MYLIFRIFHHIFVKKVHNIKLKYLSISMQTHNVTLHMGYKNKLVV